VSTKTNFREPNHYDFVSWDTGPVGPKNALLQRNWVTNVWQTVRGKAPEMRSMSQNAKQW